MSTRRSQRAAAARAIEAFADDDSPPPTRPQRSRRTVQGNTVVATVSHDRATSLSESPPSMRLTVKGSTNKLREATRVPSGGASRSSMARESFVGGEILQGKRSRNVKKSYVMESESEEEDVEMDDVGDEDAEGESIDEDEDADDDGLGDEDAEGDIDMEVPAPPPPVIKISKAQSGRQSIVVKPPSKVDHKTVEQKEADEASEDEDLSDLSSVGEDVEEEEAMQSDIEEDAEGEDEEIEEDVEEDDELDSNDETPLDGSRASTPDLSKLTKRQRARFEEDTGHLMALPDEVQVKKHFTAEEHAMRRAEMARRRKNLSEKRNEEEKMETINKLLKKQAPKTNARRKEFNTIASEATPDTEPVKPEPGFVRWVSNKEGNRIGVPEEWLDAPVGKIFGSSVKPGVSKMVQEVS